MILNRVGNKRRLAKLIVPLFPKHTAYIEPFFGAGAIFFHKPKAKYNFLTDLDSEVYNFWQVVINHKDELLEQLELMPVSEELFNAWKKEVPTDKVLKALRFLFLSNFSYLGTMDTLRIKLGNQKNAIISNIKSFLADCISDAYICNRDFEVFLKSISFHDKRPDKVNTFCYSDPPYVDKIQGMYNAPKWTLQDLERLIDILNGMGIKYAISEYSTESVLKLAEEKGLNVHYLKELQTLKDRNVEILITNYKTNQLSLF